MFFEIEFVNRSLGVLKDYDNGSRIIIGNEARVDLSKCGGYLVIIEKLERVLDVARYLLKFYCLQNYYVGVDNFAANLGCAF